MKSQWIRLSAPRRFLTDFLRLARQIPTVPVQRQMSLAPLAVARAALPEPVSWPALFLKAFALVAADSPPLRRAYLNIPWPHLCEYPNTVATIAVERMYQGESCVFFGRIPRPDNLSLREIHNRIRTFAESPIETVTSFRQMLTVAALPGFVRRRVLWLGLNVSRIRSRKFGTFGLSVYSSLGAESLHPLSPLTTTMTYGVIAANGTVAVRLVYDHRVFDGTTAARALVQLEKVLTGPILTELQDMIEHLKIAA